MIKFTFVILHGWGLSSKKFEGLAMILRTAGHRVFVPDLPGFGDSALPSTPLHLSDYTNFLTEYCKENTIKNPILIGHSFGGRIALQYSHVYPSEIRALILTGTPGFSPVSRKKIILAAMGAKIGKILFLLPVLSHLKEAVRRWYYFAVGARDYSRASGVMRETFKNIVQEDISKFLPSVFVPCALVWGSEDTITPLWIAEKMHKYITSSRIITIPGSDHGVSYKKPELFVASIKPFLQTL